jgi:hypothetical protein
MSDYTLHLAQNFDCQRVLEHNWDLSRPGPTGQASNPHKWSIHAPHKPIGLRGAPHGQRLDPADSPWFPGDGTPSRSNRI